MKINEIIREKRKERNLTQEQVAISLGVSTPAVNKWEKGISFPDITTLPPLARLLRVDLNTLLCFHDELSEKEIHDFVGKLQEIIQEKGFPFGFQTAMEKIQEYPTCDLLIQLVACTLSGALMLFAGGVIENAKEYEDEIDNLLERISHSRNLEIRDFANGILIHKYIQSEHFEKAQILIDNYPNPSFDKKQLQASLFEKQDKLEDAAKLLEENLMLSANEIQTLLHRMALIALKEDQTKSAQYFADMTTKTSTLYDLYKIGHYNTHLSLAFHQKDTTLCITLLKSILPLMIRGGVWDFKSSHLYKHIKPNINNTSTIMTSQMLSGYLQGIQANKEYEFLWSSPEFLELVKEYS